MKRVHDPAISPPSRFGSFGDLEGYLDRLGLFRMDFGLGRMEAFVDAFTRADGPLPFPVIQVVGTNGKGSTSAYLAALAEAHGVRSGLFTSPHFLSVRERVLVSGRMLPEGEWVRLGNRVLELGRGLGLTYFEFVTALSIVAFAEAGVGAAVYEAGLGGRYDATTVLPAAVTVFTPIGLDHQGILGATVGEIGRDKAQALRPGSVGVSGVQVPEAAAELRQRVEETGCRLVRVEQVDPLLDGLELAMAGPFQRSNASLALAAWRVFAKAQSIPLDEAACRRALAGTALPGRLQRVPAAPGWPEIILDGAHNPPALAVLAEALAALCIQPAALVFTALADKNLEAILPMAAGLTDGSIVVPELPGNERAVPAAELAARLGPRASAAPDIARALDRLAGSAGPVLVCGSLYLLAEFFTFRPDSLVLRLGS